MAKQEHYDTVSSWNTKRTVEVTTSPAGNLTGKCSGGDWERTSAGGNDVQQAAREHLRWQHS